MKTVSKSFLLVQHEKNNFKFDELCLQEAQTVAGGREPYEGEGDYVPNNGGSGSAPHTTTYIKDHNNPGASGVTLD